MSEQLHAERFVYILRAWTLDTVVTNRNFIMFHLVAWAMYHSICFFMVQSTFLKRGV